jgi:hypothetical protein
MLCDYLRFSEKRIAKYKISLYFVGRGNLGDVQHFFGHILVSVVMTTDPLAAW